MTAAELAALYESAFGEPLSDVRYFENILASDTHHVAASKQSFAIGRLAADEAELLWIGTAPEARGTGAARAILADLHHCLAKAGATQIFLEVRADNAAAHALYTSLGYTQAARRPRYYTDGTDAVLMSRALP